MSGFESVIEKFRAESESTVALGNAFERLIKNFLLTDPTRNFDKVWLWNEFPYRETIDLGIDIVALDHHDCYWAIQCKFWQPYARIDKPAVDSFLGASGKSFHVDNQPRRFDRRLWIATTDLWNANALDEIEHQTPPFSRIGLEDLKLAPVDWQKLEQGIVGREAIVKNTLRPHQAEAVNTVVEKFKTADRGKLIMACGTGKTFTSLKIAERLVGHRGVVLYLTPSISLLNQTLLEWTAQADTPVNAICVCSDETAAKADDIPRDEPILPSTTDPHEINRRIRADQFNVIFSTYQSLDAVAAAQSLSLRITNYALRIDLIIADEAHRTSGFEAKGKTAPLFKRVHDNDFIRAKKRLYMTATPKLYRIDKKSDADNLTLWSMDDPSVFGEDFYVLKFSDALDHKLLTDYRVLVFTVREEDVPTALADQFSISDIAKIYGCVNALDKHLSRESEYILRDDPNPMRSAVAYCSSIKMSKDIARLFNAIEPKIDADHVDGSMRSSERKIKLEKLRNVDENSCRILTNARCLSEGIDVPALDAVMFLSPRKSQVDIIQAVGRVMRKAEGKHYGYVILPIVIPRGANPVDELNHNKDFDIVWQVLNALRAHDDRFYIEVNKLALNNNQNALGNRKLIIDAPVEYQMTLDFGEYRNAIVARIVEKVGDRQYWATWGRDVAVIAERHKARIKEMIAVEGRHRAAFDEFLGGLRRNINPSVTADDAVDMLAQHLITRPVFEALFENFNFMKQNAVSRSMQNILNLLDDAAVDKDNEKLDRVYKSVRERCSDIQNPSDRQKIIIELYDKFFKIALHKTAETLGIVYTPLEIVDFILNSVQDILRADFDRTLSDAGVNILDPFTGTGTFIARMIEQKFIDDAALHYKYSNEIFANEIVLLAYYMACINIENAFHARVGDKFYMPFPGISFTDTFQTSENDETNYGGLFSREFLQNAARIEHQKATDIQVIIGNPPYSVGQRSANDNAQNQSYPNLEQHIAETYAAFTGVTNKNSLYDSYIKAIRWAGDRVDPDGGVIGFVTNAGWIDSAAMDGMRKCLEEDFTSLYIFNLRGAIRGKIGDAAKREGQNLFDIMTGVAITIFVRDPKVDRSKAEIHYVDIGNYLDREAKKRRLVAFRSCLSEMFKANETIIKPNSRHDWINQRGALFDTFIPIEPEKKFDDSARSFFTTYSMGINTARDAWAYNYSRDVLEKNMRQTINFYNANIGRDPIYDSTNINWADGLKQQLKRGDDLVYDDNAIVEGIYRPFCRQRLYYDQRLNERTYQMPRLFPTGGEDNRLICVSGIGSIKNFSVLMVDRIPCLDLIEKVQCFPLLWYDADGERHDGISEHILREARHLYGVDVSKDDIFYYVYGFLHLPAYREKFANELRKSLPKLILVPRGEDFRALSKAGRELAELHLNYETQPPPEGVQLGIRNAELGMDELNSLDDIDWRVTKMRLSKDRSTLQYNSAIRIKNIPARSFEYVVNGRSPLEWIIDRYQVKVDKASQLLNDPNLWCEEHGDARYILRLIGSVLTVSLRTMEIVDALPAIAFDG